MTRIEGKDTTIVVRDLELESGRAVRAIGDDFTIVPIGNVGDDLFRAAARRLAEAPRPEVLLVLGDRQERIDVVAMLPGGCLIAESRDDPGKVYGLRLLGADAPPISSEDWERARAEVIAGEFRRPGRAEIARERATRKALKVRARRRLRVERRTLAAMHRDYAAGRPARRGARLWRFTRFVTRTIASHDLKSASGSDLDRLAWDRYGIRR